MGLFGLLPWVVKTARTLEKPGDSRASGVARADSRQSLRIVSLALPFLSLGGWCLFFPASVERLCFKKKYRHGSLTSKLLISCFGSQAVLMGLSLACLEPTKEFYAVFSAALMPFFAFNAWAILGDGRKVFTDLIWLDFFGNCFLLYTSIRGVLCFAK